MTCSVTSVYRHYEPSPRQSGSTAALNLQEKTPLWGKIRINSTEQIDGQHRNVQNWTSTCSNVWKLRASKKFPPAPARRSV